MDDKIFTYIGSLGFPIAVTVYLLVYFRKTMDSLRDSINALTAVVTKLCERMSDKS